MLQLIHYQILTTKNNTTKLIGCVESKAKKIKKSIKCLKTSANIERQICFRYKKKRHILSCCPEKKSFSVKKRFSSLLSKLYYSLYGS